MSCGAIAWSSHKACEQHGFFLRVSNTASSSFPSSYQKCGGKFRMSAKVTECARAARCCASCVSISGNDTHIELTPNLTYLLQSPQEAIKVI